MENNYKIITRKEYKNNEHYYIQLIDELFKNDDSKIANLNEFINHLQFIFSDNHNNDSMLILNVKDGKLISMINFLQYDSNENLWCLFSLFTLKSERQKGYGEKMLKFGIQQVEDKKAKMLISGIEKDNVKSINLHKKVGFKDSGKTWDQLADGFPEGHIGFIIEFG